MQDFQRIIIHGAAAIAAFTRLYENWQQNWQPPASTCVWRPGFQQICKRPPYELFVEEPIASNTSDSLILLLGRTTMSMQETVEQFVQDMTAYNFFDYEIPLYKLQQPVKPDPVTHARIR